MSARQAGSLFRLSSVPRGSQQDQPCRDQRGDDAEAASDERRPGFVGLTTDARAQEYQEDHESDRAWQVDTDHEGHEKMACGCSFSRPMGESCPQKSLVVCSPSECDQKKADVPGQQEDRGQDQEHLFNEPVVDA